MKFDNDFQEWVRIFQSDNIFKLLINKINAYDEKGGSFKIRELTDTIKALSDDYNEIDNIYDAEKILLDYGKKIKSLKTKNCKVLSVLQMTDTVEKMKKGSELQHLIRRK